MKQLVCGGLLALVALTGCGRGRAPDSLAQAYVHKYGVQTDKSDWEQRGKNGQVITTRKDGVTVTETYDGGALHGETTHTFAYSNTLHIREVYEHGRLTSRQEHHRTGVPMACSHFGTDGERSVETWYDDGTPRSLEQYHGDFLTSGQYFTPNNAIEARVEDGQGIHIVRDASGHVTAEETIFAGQAVSRSTFYPGGEPKSVTPFVNGNRHGTRKTYQPGGLPESVEEWKHGQQDGLTTVFENGRKVAEIPYVAGEKDGLERHFDSRGEVTREVTWIEGEQHGPLRYFVDGRQSAVEWFHRDRLVRKTTWERLNGFALAE